VRSTEHGQLSHLGFDIRIEISRKVLLPAALRWVFTGIRISVRYAFTAAILGEVIASNRGAGYLIEANSGQFNSTGVSRQRPAFVSPSNSCPSAKPVTSPPPTAC
jgi:hypothetical protein